MLGQLVRLSCVMDYGDAVSGPVYYPQLVLPGWAGVELQISWDIKIIGGGCDFSLGKTRSKLRYVCVGLNIPSSAEVAVETCPRIPIRNIPTSRIWFSHLAPYFQT